MFDITAMGELLIDFTQSGFSKNGMRLFEQNPGGAVANVLCAAAKLGMNTAFIGKVGKDMHGDFLKKTLQQARIDTRGLLETDAVFTTLAFVEISENGERSFSFARKPGADTCIEPFEVDEQILKNTRIFHIGSLSLTHQPARDATLFAIRKARDAGAVISYDPNYRASLWKDAVEASGHMRSVLQYIDMIKISEEELGLMTDTDSIEEACKSLHRQGIIYVAVTLGENGAFISAQNDSAYVSGFPCKVVDTTGAGDAFWGGFLHRLLKSGLKIGEYSIEELKEHVMFANATASCCIKRRGGIPAMPGLTEVMRVLNSSKK